MVHVSKQHISIMWGERRERAGQVQGERRSNTGQTQGECIGNAMRPQWEHNVNDEKITTFFYFTLKAIKSRFYKFLFVSFQFKSSRLY